MKTGYKSKTQEKNVAWFLPRPKPDHYKGGMPLYAEEWLMDLAYELLPEMESYPAPINVFCGMNKMGFRIDIKPEVKPDLIADAHELSKYPQLHKTYIILADPPYSEQEAKDLYGTPKLHYKKWTAECEKLLYKGGLLIIYHKFVMPNPNPEKFEVVKRVFIGNRPYHLPRVAIYFRKK